MKMNRLINTTTTLAMLVSLSALAEVANQITEKGNNKTLVAASQTAHQYASTSQGIKCVDNPSTIINESLSCPEARMMARYINDGPISLTTLNALSN